VSTETRPRPARGTPRRSADARAAARAIEDGSAVATSRAGAGLWAAALIALAAVLLQVTVMPYVRVADGIPDLVAAAVVSIAVLRGPLVGAVTGFCAGLLVELMAPIGTLGVLALLYVIVGWWCGRYTERIEPGALLGPLALIVAAAGFVGLGYAAVQLLLGNSVPAAMLVGKVLLPQMALTALLGPPVLLVARRLLGDPRVVEPYMGPR
jgi:rod shape-determining protein MreD